MRLKIWLGVLALSFVVGSALVFAIDRDQDRGEHSRDGREAINSGDRSSENYEREGDRWEDQREREKQWREYLRARNREYRDYSSASRRELDDFYDYLRGRGYRYGDQHGWGNYNRARNGACFFTDSHYRGGSFCLNGNESKSFVGDHYNDRISSIRVFGRARVTIYKHKNYGGSRRTYTEDAPHLGDFNDEISAIEMR